MFIFSNKKLALLSLITLMLSSSIQATSMLNDQETEVSSERICSFEKCDALRDEIEKTDYNPPLDQNEKNTVSAGTGWPFSDHLNEKQKLFVKEYSENLQKYPVEGTWVIRKEGKLVGYANFEYNPHDFDPLPSFVTLGYTEVLERERKNGVGAKGLKSIYEKFLPYVNKEIKLRKIDILNHKSIDTSVKFSGIEAEIVPHDNFASIISQMRSGASVSVYGDEVLSFFYPPLEAHTLIADFPRIEELRNIVSELENSDTRPEAKEKFYEFFASLK